MQDFLPQNQGKPGWRKWAIQPFRPIYENSPGYASPLHKSFRESANLQFSWSRLKYATGEFVCKRAALSGRGWYLLHISSEMPVAMWLHMLSTLLYTCMIDCSSHNCSKLGHIQHNCQQCLSSADVLHVSVDVNPLSLEKSFRDKPLCVSMLCYGWFW